MKESPLLCGPTPEQYESVRDALGENADRFDAALRQLGEWIERQPHLPRGYDRRLLPVFLRGCKHDVERAKRKIDTYYTLRTTAPELFSRHDPRSNEAVAAARVFHVAPMPTLTPEGHRVTFHRFVECDASLFRPRDVFRLILMLADLRMTRESAIAGDVFVFDVRHMSAGHCARLAQPTLVSRLLAGAQHAYPQRLVRIHVVNAPPYVHRLLTLFKRFMKAKMRSRFVVHEQSASIADHVPLECLPSDYGGRLRSLSDIHDAWQETALAHAAWFVEQNAVRADDGRRASDDASVAHELFGGEGAFRRLDVD